MIPKNVILARFPATDEEISAMLKILAEALIVSERERIRKELSRGTFPVHLCVYQFEETGELVVDA